jgi:hypothetical protein
MAQSNGPRDRGGRLLAGVPRRPCPEFSRQPPRGTPPRPRAARRRPEFCRSGPATGILFSARRSSSVVEQGTHKPLVGGSNPSSATSPVISPKIAGSSSCPPRGDQETLWWLTKGLGSVTKGVFSTRSARRLASAAPPQPASPDRDTGGSSRSCYAPTSLGPYLGAPPC